MRFFGSRRSKCSLCSIPTQGGWIEIIFMILSADLCFVPPRVGGRISGEDVFSLEWEHYLRELICIILTIPLLFDRI